MNTNKEVEFYCTMEATSGGVPVVDVTVEKNPVGMQYIRFRACLQAFVEALNRNKRRWKPGFIKTMIEAEIVQEMLRNGGVPGEAGHPVPDSAQPTLERICTIDPMNVSHYIENFEWKDGDKYLYGNVRTAAGQGDCPGTRLMTQVLSGVTPAFSARTIVPQKKMADGTTTVLGPGRLVCYDWVYGPSHKEAYRDLSTRVQLIDKRNFDVDLATESACFNYLQDMTAEVIRKSYNVNLALEGYDPVMETCTIDKNGNFSCDTHEGDSLIIPTEACFKDDIKNYMLRFK